MEHSNFYGVNQLCDLKSQVKKLESAVAWLFQQPRASPPHLSSQHSVSFPSSGSTVSLPLLDLTNVTPPASEVQKPKSILDDIVADKKSRPLPKINKSQLIDPQDIIDNYLQFLSRSKLPTLAVKLLKESFWKRNYVPLYR